MGEMYGAGHIPQEGEPDFIETNCHWVGCSREYETQDELVKVTTKMLVSLVNCRYSFLLVDPRCLSVFVKVTSQGNNNDACVVGELQV